MIDNKKIATEDLEARRIRLTEDLRRIDKAIKSLNPDNEMTKEPSSFEYELQQLLNRHSKDVESKTPDYVLANFLVRCLDNLGSTVVATNIWNGNQSVTIAIPSELSHNVPAVNIIRNCNATSCVTTCQGLVDCKLHSLQDLGG